MACLFTLYQLLEAFLLWAPNIANQLMELLQAGGGRGLTLCQIIAAELDNDEDYVACSVNSTAMWLLLATCALHSVVTVLISWVVDAAGRRNMSIGITLACGVAGVLVNLVPDAVGSALMFLTFTTAVVVLGFYVAITVSLFPTHLRSMAVATTMLGTRVMSVGFLQLVNYLLAHACELGFYVCSALFASSALVLALLPDDRRQPARVDAPAGEHYSSRPEH
ncbi:uncharacterized protein LOC125236693 [Leguminivora glycinivorella]|uniref:uncharacterized protein LOC125236693 n=1 Tax=Leguminivora glycinivorella TaxID=1035111 RepID=UPI00200D7561|nr:uncharacterized protein LOC125236693 [Leguminivora glycinivorella]